MLPGHVLLIVSGAFAALAVILWLVGFAVGRGRRKGWVRTTGVWTRFTGTFTRSWQVEYSTPDGQTHRIMPVMNATTLAPQGSIPVAYDPAQPRRAVIDTFYHRGGALKVMAAVGGAIALALAASAIVMLTLA